MGRHLLIRHLREVSTMKRPSRLVMPEQNSPLSAG